MQFLAALSILFVAAAAIPAPAPAADPNLATKNNIIQKRTCGTLKGNARKICQDACEAACEVGTAGVAGKLCKAACGLGAS